MARRNTHHRWRDETQRPDQLLDGVAAPERSALAVVKHNHRGHPADHASAVEMGRRGGASRRGNSTFVATLELVKGSTPVDLAPYIRAGRVLSRTLRESIARGVGGGVCGGVAGFMAAKAARASAVEQLAIAVGNYTLALKASAESRACLLTAWECASREAAKEKPGGWRKHQVPPAGGQP